MGFIRAFSGALGGSLADQWLDYYTVPNDVADTAGLFAAVRCSNNNGRGSNTKASSGIISDGSLIVVPDGFALVTVENGALTGLISEPGGYRWSSNDPQSLSVFTGSSTADAVVRQSWERFKLGGIPGSSQLALFVNKKEIAGCKFGTQSPVYWDDTYLNTQAGVTARGTYALKIDDPIKFIKTFVPARYYSPNPVPFDFQDFENDAASQLFSEVVSSLGVCFSCLANAQKTGNRLAGIQRGADDFSRILSKALEETYGWSAKRGLRLVSANVTAIDYEPSTRELLNKVQRADALSGSRGNSNLQASLAESLVAAGSNPNDGSVNLGVLGMAFQGVSSSMVGIMQPTVTQDDPYERLAKLKKTLGGGRHQ